MGLSPYPTPTDVGVLCIILVKTSMSISIMKETLRSILQLVGIQINSREEYYVEHDPTVTVTNRRTTTTNTYMDEFRTRTPSIKYNMVPITNQPESDCPVCLTEFKPQSDINHLSCGHVFHNVCLEKWLKGWNFTCPLCRNHMIPFEQGGEVEETCPM